MAIDVNVAHRYAAALFSRAKKTGVLRGVADEVRLLIPVFRGNRGLRMFMESPRIPRSKKRELIEKTLSHSITSQLDEFILLMIERGRINELREAIDHFLKMEEEDRGVFPGEVTTAVALSAGEQERLKKSLERHTGHTLNLTFHVDPEILGGVVFRHRDDLLDSSLRSGLEDIRDQLAEVRVHS